MKPIACVIVVLLAGGTALQASASGDHAKGQPPPHARSGKHKGSDTSVGVHIVFAPAEVTVLRDYYGPRYRDLPPGLQKKVARGGTLPPGWQKRFAPFPPDLERRLIVLPVGYRRGVIDGHAVIYDSRTHVIVDIAVLF